VNGLTGFGFFLELGFLVPHRIVILLRYRISPFMEFHFAQVDDSVVPVDQKIDLRRRSAPGVGIRLHAPDAQSLLDLVEMFQAQSLKGKADPRGMYVGIGLETIYILSKSYDLDKSYV